ncbi:MAG: hypothetical protein P8P49_03050, partial [Opitutales bacterium]|nr:hypothetical protein [Opitutales bacterium]
FPVSSYDDFYVVLNLSTELIQDKTYLKSVLAQGANAAQKRAYKVLGKVYRKVGFPERDRK